MSVKIVEVNSDNTDRRLDNYLISILKDIPKSKIYKIIRKGEVRVNSSRAKPDYKIKKGDLIRIPPNLEISNKNKKFIKPKLINEFNQEKIQKVNELSEIIYYLKLYKGF
jgi:23S rRNA pseudouridine955/2504/2580 synthase